MFCAPPGGPAHPQGLRTLSANAPTQVSFSLSEFALTGGNLEEVLNTHALLMKLGHGEAPAMRSSNYENVAVLEYDESYLAAALEAGGAWYKAGDWRCARRPACDALMLAPTLPVAGYRLCS